MALWRAAALVEPCGVSSQLADAWRHACSQHWEPHASTEERVSHTDIDVSDCLNMFSRREQLGENDKWYCGHCKEHRQAYKKFDLWKAPEILIIHLKRFSYSQVRACVRVRWLVVV